MAQPTADDLTARRQTGDLLRASEMGRPIEFRLTISPKEVLDKLPTQMIIDYLMLNRNVTIRDRQPEGRGGA